MINTAPEMPLLRIKWLQDRLTGKGRLASFRAQISEALEGMIEDGYTPWHDRYHKECEQGVTYFMHVGNPVIS